MFYVLESGNHLDLGEKSMDALERDPELVNEYRRLRIRRGVA